MQANALADFLESRELDLVERWNRAFIKESSHCHHSVRTVSPNLVSIIFKQILSLLRANPEVAGPIGHREVYIEGADRHHISDLLEVLLSGELVLRKEILSACFGISFERVAEQLEEINAAFHQMLQFHVAEFCCDCADSLMEYCREVNEQAAHAASAPRVSRPLHDPLEHRCLAFAPPLQPHTNVQGTLTAFLRANRQEILGRWRSLVEESEEQRFRERVGSVHGALSELLDEVVASVASCTLRAPHLGNTPAPTDAAPNALHVIVAGEEAIAGLLRCLHPVIDEFWVHLRAQLNDAFHQLLRNNVASECARCHTLLGASRGRLRAMERRLRPIRRLRSGEELAADPDPAP